jgi:hypothetical protein
VNCLAKGPSLTGEANEDAVYRVMVASDHEAARAHRPKLPAFPLPCLLKAAITQVRRHCETGIAFLGIRVTREKGYHDWF